MTITRELVHRKRDEIFGIASRYGASNLRIFGSILNDEPFTSEDLDLLIDMEESRDILDRIALARALAACLSCRVDVVTAADLTGSYREAILAEAVPI
ncbi:MAG: nucleotidyltransferase [Methanomicrobiaceae archaeon]|nr:nucleotidyltransferase [Methanomicrobiaceae archaeon]